jgi:Ni/Co efflux regulator RcnB
MNRKLVISAVLAMSLGAAGFAFADNHGDRGDRGRNDQMQRSTAQNRQDARQPNRQENWNRGHSERIQRGAKKNPHDMRRTDRRDNRDRVQRNYARRDERGAGPHHEFHRGMRLPREYRNRQYVVDNWRGHHLSAPPRGYHWVQTGSDYVLVAIATGIILQLILSN